MKGGSTIGLALLALVALVALVIALQARDGWRQAGIKAAEQRMRAELSDPGAKFSEEELTGDQTSGQTCGRVQTSSGASERFIVYIDTPEPYIDGGLGHKVLSQEDFEGYWTNDCLKEGYNLAPSQGGAR
jgi:hypothetical protein